MTTKFAVGLTVVALFGLSACGGGGDTAADTTPQGTPKSALTLKSFQQNCIDFLAYVSDSLTEQYLTQYRCLGDFAICPAIESFPASAPTPNAGSGSAADAAQPTRVSQTNVQEAGVDEADIVKADALGNLYILSGQTLSTIAAFPAAGLQDRALNSFSFGDEASGFYARDFFLDEAAKRLVVLGDQYTQTGSEAVSVLLDVSNPAAPVETGRLSVQGYGMEARRIGARVHRVVRTDITEPTFMFSSNDPLSARRDAYFAAQSRNDSATAQTIKSEIRAEIARRVSVAGADSFLPKLRSTLAGVSSEQSLSCNRIARPEVTVGMGFALVDSFNTDGSSRASSAVVNNSSVTYASEQNLYLTQNSGGWVFGPFPTSSNQPETVIYRLSLSPTGAAVYQGLGRVAGSLIGSYALSEHEGHLRVASTDDGIFNGTQAPQSVNHLTILRANQSGDLNEVSSIKGLAPGERIQGVRFVGDRGYVVTFRRIDPLFAFDLSNPASPQLRSELKIPGFSSYLMPVGENHLLTIGRAGDDQGVTGQVQVSLFDVSDLGNVRQTATLSPLAGPSGYSYSAAEYDPHAFSYFSDSATAASPGTLSIPLQTNGSAASDNFTGFLVVRVDPAATTPLREAGRIDHRSFAAAQPQTCTGGGRPPSGEFISSSMPCFDAIYSTEPRRSVFIEDSSGATVLYTISALGLLASNAANPAEELGRKPLPYDPPCCYAVPVSSAGNGSSISGATTPASPTP